MILPVERGRIDRVLDRGRRGGGGRLPGGRGLGGFRRGGVLLAEGAARQRRRDDGHGRRRRVGRDDDLLAQVGVVLQQRPHPQIERLVRRRLAALQRPLGHAGGVDADGLEEQSAGAWVVGV